MGVPKFYRWISERYPCLSEVVREFQIPDFDNLYLDMNGIIHTCSHPNDDDPHFRISEEAIFDNICHYIEFLFRMVKPSKVFFMAVDGVAPRAKMNQQRGRRFRTAQAALRQEEEALACGEILPTEKRFDSNCITPGTPFMARLHTVLKGFVEFKVSTDKLWRGVRVFLSGHETPGEGEHKIMDFIRYEKSQAGYNPNVKHCLYGLDADLIMLGLSSHEPHFCLLREEVKFGRQQQQKRLSTPEQTTFHLLHISLMRDYLDHEFSPVKQKLAFPYDLEKIIDDFVLMSFLVGNDFIPNLPQLHINHDALPLLFRTYSEILPLIGGYINEAGTLNLRRFEKFLGKLAEFDFEKFKEMSDDFAYLESKTSKLKSPEEEQAESRTSTILSQLGFSNLAIEDMADFESSNDDDMDSMLETEFVMHKTNYYMEKLGFSEVTPLVLQEQATCYVRAIQWNLHYYYNGCVSWSWYYPHHYSPYISDIKNFKKMDLSFDMGKPFMPFQQLLGVLPKLSKEFLPESYQNLMCDPESPLYDFYPDDFETDLNGKQQEWEAVVLIPFINEDLLTKCTEMADKELNEDERRRNSHGPHLLYTFSEKSKGFTPSFLPGHYPPLSDQRANCREISVKFFCLPAKSIFKGLCRGVVMDKFIAGFPSLKTLSHSSLLAKEKVKVFQQPSQKDNMMLIVEDHKENDLTLVGDKVLGKTIHVGWPHLREALVVSASDRTSRVRLKRDQISGAYHILEEALSPDERKTWKCQCDTVENETKLRWGIIVGEIEVLLHVRCYSGSKYIISNDGRVSEQKQFEGSFSNYALQTTVWDLETFSPNVKAEKSIKDVFEVGSPVFVLAPEYYGCMGAVCDFDIATNNGKIIVDIETIDEPNLLRVIRNEGRFMKEDFMHLSHAAYKLGIDSNTFSRLTGTIMIQTSPKESSSPNKVNIGLNLKFNRSNEEVQGFTKKINNQWYYTEEVLSIFDSYYVKFRDFFERLYPHIGNDVIYLEDLYPDGSGEGVMKEIQEWMKGQACAKANRQSIGIERLDYGIIEEIEKIVENFNFSTKHVMFGVSPSQLYSPFQCKGVFMPDQKTTFQLYDRVVNVGHTSSVPMGFRGTVIGIQSAEKDCDFVYEVLFDKEFVGGMSISSLSKKGYRMSPNVLINLTHGLRTIIQNNSPAKRSKRNLIPRLQKSQISRLQAELTTPPPPVQILQKKPFYKADAADSNASVFNRFPPTPFGVENARFVTPKATSPGNMGNYNIHEKSYHSPQFNHETFWTDLRKESVPLPEANSDEQSPPSSLQADGSGHNYGQKVSVEELFKGVQNQLDKGNGPAVNTEAVNALRSVCLDVLKAPPLYSYYNYNKTSLIMAAITLPGSEEKFSSLPMNSKQEAAADASEKALAYLRSRIKTGHPSLSVQKSESKKPELQPNANLIGALQNGPFGYANTSENYGNNTPAVIPNSEQLFQNRPSMGHHAGLGGFPVSGPGAFTNSRHGMFPNSNPGMFPNGGPGMFPNSGAGMFPPGMYPNRPMMLPNGGMFPNAGQRMFPNPTFGMYPNNSPVVPNNPRLAPHFIPGVPPPNLMRTPPLCYPGGFAQPPFKEAPFMRCAVPQQPFIPQSFVQANQHLMQNPDIEQTFDPNSEIFQEPKTPNDFERNVFHLPGGGTATIKEAVCQRMDLSSGFVPHQVMKQNAQPLQENLYREEWPKLPVKVEEQRAKKHSEESSKSRAYSDASKESCSEVSKDHAANNTKPKSQGMTVLKPKTKRRIAANFQNAE